MDELTEALDALASERLDGLFGPALLERAALLVRAANRLSAELARTTRQCEVAGAHEHDGKASMAACCAGTIGCRRVRPTSWCATGGRWSSCRLWLQRRGLVRWAPTPWRWWRR